MLIVWNIFFCGANGSKVVDVIQHPDRKIEGPEDSDQTVSKEEEERITYPKWCTNEIKCECPQSNPLNVKCGVSL